MNPYPMKKLTAAYTAVAAALSRPILIRFLIIFVLFGCILLNYFIEEKVHTSVKNHNNGTALVVKHEQYKQVVDKTNYTLSQIDNELSNYILTGSEHKLNSLNVQIENMQGNISLIRDEAVRFVPKYLVNLFLHKVRNRLYFQTEIMLVYSQQGKKAAISLLNNTEDRNTYTEYAKSETELIGALNKKIDQLNNSLLTESKATLQLDTRWNIISLILMLVITIVVLYQTTKISKLNTELEVAVKKMKHATEVKDQFMSNVTHELRTPLNSILGYTNLLLKRQHQPETEKWIEAVHSSGAVLLDIINDVLDYSKLESGYLSIASESFVLDDVLSNLKNIMGNRAETKLLSLVVLKDHALPTTFKGDEKKLKQILINLTGNAIKFTESGTVKIEVLLHKQLGDQLWLTFIVSDTGIGIKTENLPHVFDRFYQVENSYSKKYSGTGLGLPIVKQLVDMQGGTITVKSLPEQGTSFTFVLPFEVSKIVEKETELSLAPVRTLLKGAKKKILVVDDHELNRDLLVLLLKEYNCNAVTAQNGNEAIQLLKEKKFDLVLMDVQMPEINGIEATQIIRNHLTLDVPVIACTAFSQPVEKQACALAGMNDYLGKPIDEAELLKLLNKYLNQNKEAEKNYALVNYNQIKGITGSNKELTDVILSKAIDMIPEELEKLHQAILHFKYQEAKELAHTMCSTLGLMGAPAELMKQVKTMQNEFTSNAQVHETVLHLYYEVNDTVKKMVTELRNYLAA